MKSWGHLFQLVCLRRDVAAWNQYRCRHPAFRPRLAKAYLAGANLAGASLANADLTNAYLANADLTNAYLAKANLAGAWLTNADLAGAYLANANLAEANLVKANLARANLASARLAKANLAGANLMGTKLIDLGQDSRGYRLCIFKADDGIRILAGCRYFTAWEASEHWGSPEYPDYDRGQDYLDRIEAGMKIAKRKEWIE